MKIENEAGVLNAKMGLFNGKESVFTHRNPANGEVWGEDLMFRTENGLEQGRWVSYDSVDWL